ncbi:hypothetical protein HPB50_008672 [Hyalomma asiaticum]|uniref:Uncharacterized protein n=1 Tax=Hyalomma asiaticum TaxID=266040 RepID=A0ACB7SL89_HYAAI|nr:hypothetical protein HPB50_008672 [Hyalomma asiaticum]
MPFTSVTIGAARMYAPEPRSAAAPAGRSPADRREAVIASLLSAGLRPADRREAMTGDSNAHASRHARARWPCPSFVWDSARLTKMAASKATSGRLHFSIAYDLALLREVNAHNPFQDPSRWEAIVKNMNFALGNVFSARALRERLDLLLAQFIANDRVSLRNARKQLVCPSHVLAEAPRLVRRFDRTVQNAAVSGLPKRGTRSAYEQPKRSAVRCCRFRKWKGDEAHSLSRACSDFAHFKTATSGDGTLSASAAASPDSTAWEDVLRNVMKAVHRELTIRGIKEHVDLLDGYFRQQDTANLIKSGTKEQYGEWQQLLQDISDFIREAIHVPRTVPWRGNGMGPRQTVGLLTSAKVHNDMAMQIKDSGMASIPAVQASDDLQKEGK